MNIENGKETKNNSKKVTIDCVLLAPLSLQENKHSMLKALADSEACCNK